jgi:hypothetical protein
MPLPSVRTLGGTRARQRKKTTHSNIEKLGRKKGKFKQKILNLKFQEMNGAMTIINYLLEIGVNFLFIAYTNYGINFSRLLLPHLMIKKLLLYLIMPYFYLMNYLKRKYRQVDLYIQN